VIRARDKATVEARSNRGGRGFESLDKSHPRASLAVHAYIELIAATGNARSSHDLVLHTKAVQHAMTRCCIQKSDHPYPEGYMDRGGRGFESLDKRHPRVSLAVHAYIELIAATGNTEDHHMTWCCIPH
jgi:hypothetical protein